MKRALLVSTGTLLGLYGTLSYAPSQANDQLNLALGSSGQDSPSPVATDGTSANPSSSASAQPTSSPDSTSSSNPGPSKTSNPGPSKQPTAKPSATSSSPAASGVKDGDYTGTVERAGRYGVVQVQIRVAGGKMVDVGVLSYPNGDPESRSIASYSIPRLRDAALAAQSAQISGVSGASFTSMAFINSLAAAISQAGL